MFPHSLKTQFVPCHPWAPGSLLLLPCLICTAGPGALLGASEPQDFVLSLVCPHLAGEKTPEEGCLLSAVHAPGPEARCAALREEFLAFRRRRDATRARLPAYRQPVPHPEQATLL